MYAVMVPINRPLSASLIAKNKLDEPANVRAYARPDSAVCSRNRWLLKRMTLGSFSHDRYSVETHDSSKDSSRSRGDLRLTCAGKVMHEGS
jgi:hypothetical protein